MSDLLFSFVLLLLSFLWSLAVKKGKLSGGPRWLRGFIAFDIFCFCLLAIAGYVEQTQIHGWASAMANLLLVTLLVFMACLNAVILMAIEKEYFFCFARTYRGFVLSIIEEDPADRTSDDEN